MIIQFDFKQSESRSGLFYLFDFCLNGKKMNSCYKEGQRCQMKLTSNMSLILLQFISAIKNMRIPDISEFLYNNILMILIKKSIFVHICFGTFA